MATDRDAMQDKAMEKIKRPRLGGELERGLPAEKGCQKELGNGFVHPPRRLLFKMLWRHLGMCRGWSSEGHWKIWLGSGSCAAVGPTVSAIEAAHLLSDCSQASDKVRFWL